MATYFSAQLAADRWRFNNPMRSAKVASIGALARMAVAAFKV
ncbi:hypothetical protein [Roseivivax sp. GX 12232]|nr:hypothetical protein [Roseivivax sp. GX 12232]